MVCPNQAVSLQGYLDVNLDTLAGNDLGTVSGWQQSKENQTLSAVVGEQTRMDCNDLWHQELIQLHILYVGGWNVLVFSACTLAFLLSLGQCRGTLVP